MYAEAAANDPVSHSSNMEWHELSGRAVLSTFTCISVAPASLEAKGFGRNNPYCTGIVTLEEGPRISARIAGVDASNRKTSGRGWRCGWTSARSIRTSPGWYSDRPSFLARMAQDKPGLSWFALLDSAFAE